MKITKKILNEWALDVYNKKYDSLNYTQQSLIQEKAELHAKQRQKTIRVNIQEYYDDVAMDKYGKLYKQCNNIEKGFVKMLANQNAKENNIELYGYIVGE